MRLRVVYFASARDSAGKKEELFSMQEGATAQELAEKIESLHPGIKAIRNSVRYAVNLEIASPGEVLHDGDEVGVLPAVTGG